MGSLLTNCAAVLHTATPNQAPLLRSGPGLGSTEKVRSIEVEGGSEWILGFGVGEAHHSHGQAEQRAEEWGHMCRQEHRRTADEICGGKHRMLFFFNVSAVLNVCRDILIPLLTVSAPSHLQARVLSHMAWLPLSQGESTFSWVLLLLLFLPLWL